MPKIQDKPQQDKSEQVNNHQYQLHLKQDMPNCNRYNILLMDSCKIKVVNKIYYNIVFGKNYYKTK